MAFNIRLLDENHLSQMYPINQSCLPWVGSLSPNSLNSLLHLAKLSLGAFYGDELIGFAICFEPGSAYASPNYRWFSERYERFLYVDRIAVQKRWRNQGVGKKIYAELDSILSQNVVPILAEVLTNPKNEPSLHFHRQFGFAEVGQRTDGEQSIVMLARMPSP